MFFVIPPIALVQFGGSVGLDLISWLGVKDVKEGFVGDLSQLGGGAWWVDGVARWQMELWLELNGC